MHSYQIKSSEIKAELELSLAERSALHEQQLRTAIQSNRVQDRNQAEAIKQQAVELLALTKDPEHYFSVKDAETLYKLLYLNPSEDDPGATEDIPLNLPKSYLDDYISDEFEWTLLQHLARNHELNSIYKAINPDNFSQLICAFYALPYREDVEKLATEEMQKDANTLDQLASQYLIRTRPNDRLVDLMLQLGSKGVAMIATDYLKESSTGCAKLSRLLESNSSNLRWNAARALGDSPKNYDYSVQMFERLQVEKAEDVRSMLISSLGKSLHGKKLLLGYFKSGESSLATQAELARQLEGLAEAWPMLIQVLEERASNEDHASKMLMGNCAQALRGAKEANELLVSLALSGDDIVALGAIKGLAGDPNSISTLSEIATNDTFLHKDDAITALASIPGAEPILAEIALNDNVVSRFERCATALAEQPEAAATLLKLLEQVESIVKRKIILHASMHRPVAKKLFAAVLESSNSQYERTLAYSVLQGQPQYFNDSLACFFDPNINPNIKPAYKELPEKVPNFGTVMLRRFINL